MYGNIPTELKLLSINPRLTPEDLVTKKMPWLASPNISPHQVVLENSLEQFALNMLSRIILAQEFYMKRRSCMRLFVRMDISVFQQDGMFHYMVNELTSSQHTALFMEWGLDHMDFCIQDLAKSLHFVAHLDLQQRNQE
jgi:hypothetical protein